MSTQRTTSMIKKFLGALAMAVVFAWAGMTAGLVFAQTTATSTTVTPGTPNTGSGGDAIPNALLLGSSGIALLVGGTYLVRKGAEA